MDVRALSTPAASRSDLALPFSGVDLAEASIVRSRSVAEPNVPRSLRIVDSNFALNLSPEFFEGSFRGFDSREMEARKRAYQ